MRSILANRAAGRHGPRTPVYAALAGSENGAERGEETVRSRKSISSLASCFSRAGQHRQAADRLLEHLGALAEGEPNHGAARLPVVVVEDGARDGDHARPVREAKAELHRVLLAEGG